MTNNDLPPGYRWANEEECEAINAGSGQEHIVVPRTADHRGIPYTQGEADVAVPLKPKVVDDRPFSVVPDHINTSTGQAESGHFCSGGGQETRGGQCPKGCDHADHYSNDGHPECDDPPRPPCLECEWEVVRAADGSATGRFKLIEACAEHYET